MRHSCVSLVPRRRIVLPASCCLLLTEKIEFFVCPLRIFVQCDSSVCSEKPSIWPAIVNRVGRSRRGARIAKSPNGRPVRCRSTTVDQEGRRHVQQHSSQC